MSLRKTADIRENQAVRLETAEELQEPRALDFLPSREKEEGEFYAQDLLTRLQSIEFKASFCPRHGVKDFANFPQQDIGLERFLDEMRAFIDNALMNYSVVSVT